MNKILVDGEKFLLDNVNTAEITVDGLNNILYINNNSESLDLRIIMNPFSSLTIFDFNLCNKKQSVEVVQDNNSKFEYYHSFKTEGQYDLNYKAIINGDNNENNIFVRGVSLDNNYINVDGVINEHSKGNVLNEDLRMLNLGGNAYVSPMLHVSALDVIANHNTAISNIREDELFYLKSKGISEENCIKLISDGYLYGLFKKDEYFLNLITNNNGGE